MDLTFNHVVKYTNKRSVDVEDIAHSLIAVAQAAELLPKVLENLFDGLTVSKIEVDISQLSRSSYLEDLLVKISVKQIERLVEKTAKATGLKTLEENKRLISILLLALILYGGIHAASKVTPDKPAINITGSHNTVVVVAGDMIGASPDEVRLKIEESLSPRQKAGLARTAIDFFTPAKREDGAEVESGGYLIPRAAINEVPHADLYEEFENDFRQQELSQVDVVFRQINLDSGEHGWRCVLPILGDSDQRIRLTIVPGIDLQKHWKRGRVIGDVVVTYKRDSKGKERPTEVVLYKVYDS